MARWSKVARGAAWPERASSLTPSNQLASREGAKLTAAWRSSSRARDTPAAAPPPRSPVAPSPVREGETIGGVPYRAEPTLSSAQVLKSV